MTKKQQKYLAGRYIAHVQTRESLAVLGGICLCLFVGAVALWGLYLVVRLIVGV